MAELPFNFSSSQWNFLAVFEVFEEPVSLDIVGSLAPLTPGLMFDLLRLCEESGWIHRTENGWFSLSSKLPNEVCAKLRKINSRPCINALLNQLQSEKLTDMVSPAAYARLLTKAGQDKENARLELERYREFIRNLNRSTKQKEINKIISDLISFQNNIEYSIDYIDIVIDLSNRILSTSRLIVLLKKVLKIAVKVDDQRRWALVNFKLGHAYYSEFRINDAFSALTAGKEKVEALCDKDLTAQSIGYLGFYYHIQGLFPETLNYLQSVSNMVKYDNIYTFSWTPIILSISEAHMGRFHSAIGRLDYLCHYVCIKHNDRLEVAIRSMAKLAMGMLLFSEGKLDIAENCFQEIYQSKMIDSAQLRFYSLKCLGYLYIKQGKVAEGLELWTASFKGWHQNTNQGQYVSAWILETLTNIAQNGYQPPDGWKFEDQYSSIKRGPNLHLRGVALRMKASDTWLCKDDDKSAIKYLKASEKDLLQTGDKIQLARTWIEMSKIEKSRGNIDESRNLILKARTELSEYDDRSFPTDLQLMFGQLTDTDWRKGESLELMNGLFELLGKLSPSSTLDEAFGFILSAVADYFHSERVGFFKIDKDIKKLTELSYSLNLSKDEVASADFYPILMNIKKCYRQAVPILVGKNCDSKMMKPRSPKSYFCIPLLMENLLSGVIYGDNLYLDISIDEIKQNVLQRLGPYLTQYLQKVNEFTREMTSAQSNALEISGQISRQRYPDMIYESKEMSKTVTQAGRMAFSEATTLIHGETGVGKEMMAKWMHENSPFYKNPFVTVDFSTIPENLLESEIFGHEKGAFTGADRKKIGRIELANNGTLFVDEVGEIPIHLQVKLLRVLQEKQFFRVGGIKAINSNFRLLVATNRDLAKEVAAGRFRQDLYYRLNVLNLKILPLRERRVDIITLTHHFFNYFIKKHNRPTLLLLPEHEALLKNYDWPGNIRELKSAIERSVLVSEDDKLEIDIQIQSTLSADHPFDHEPTLDELQAQYIKHILNKCNGRIGGPKGAANVLGLKRTSLYARMKKLGLPL